MQKKITTNQKKDHEMPHAQAVITDYIGTLTNAHNYSLKTSRIKLHKILTETGFKTNRKEFLEAYTHMLMKNIALHVTKG